MLPQLLIWLSEGHQKNFVLRTVLRIFKFEKLVKETLSFCKTVLKKSFNYFYNYASTANQFYQARNSSKFLHMSCRTVNFANSYFPRTIKEWNNSNLKILKSVSFQIFKNSLLKFMRPAPNSLFNVSQSLGIKLLTNI